MLLNLEDGVLLDAAQPEQEASETGAGPGADPAAAMQQVVKVGRKCGGQN